MIAELKKIFSAIRDCPKKVLVILGVFFISVHSFADEFKELFRSPNAPQELSLDFCGGYIQIITEPGDFSIACRKIKYPNAEIEVRKINTGLFISSAIEDNTIVDYQIKIPKDSLVKHLRLNGGDLLADFKIPNVQSLHINVGDAKGYVGHFFGNLYFSAGYSGGFMVSYDGFSSIIHDKKLIPIKANTNFATGDFTFKLPSDSKVNVSIPSGLDPVETTFHNEFIHCPHPDIYIGGNFCSGTYRVLKKSEEENLTKDASIPLLSMGSTSSMGPLTRDNSKLKSLSVTGPTKLFECEAKGNVKILGSANFEKCIFEGKCKINGKTKASNSKFKEEVKINGRVKLEHCAFKKCCKINGRTESSDSTFDGEAKFNGRKRIHNCIFKNSCTINGRANVLQSEFKSNVRINGDTTITSSNLEKEIFLGEGTFIFNDCKIDSIQLEKPRPSKTQTIELNKGTVVNQSIIFESGNGKVILREGSKVKGKIIGGEIITK